MNETQNLVPCDIDDAEFIRMHDGKLFPVKDDSVRRISVYPKLKFPIGAIEIRTGLDSWTNPIHVEYFPFLGITPMKQKPPVKWEGEAVVKEIVDQWLDSGHKYETRTHVIEIPKGQFPDGTKVKVTIEEGRG